LLAFFISWSASVIFSPMDDDDLADILLALLDRRSRVQHVVS
jgi:hypothetical protein